MRYDDTGIPAVYDRARTWGPEVMELWMRTVEASTSSAPPPAAILDLGCGTGRFSGGLAHHFHARVVGIDPSRKMIEQATAKATAKASASVRYLLGAAEQIPLADATVDLIFMSMVFHHFTNPPAVAAECRRVLGVGGHVFLRAGTADRIHAYPYVPFFPSSVPLLRATLPTCARMSDLFRAVGLQKVAEAILVQQITSTHAEYAERLSLGGDSVLARLAAADFEEGLSLLRRHAARIDPSPVREPIDYLVFRR
jgi:ubiquinone/menaquinone biosynthesis C-methylase UbiE